MAPDTPVSVQTLQVRWGVEKEREAYDAYLNNVHGAGAHILIKNAISLENFLEGTRIFPAWK